MIIPDKKIVKENKLKLQLWSREVDKKIVYICWKTVKLFFALIVVIAALIYIDEWFTLNNDFEYYGDSNYDTAYGGDSGTGEDAEDSDCNVKLITLHGELVTYIMNEDRNNEGYTIVDKEASEYIVSMLREAESNNNTKAVLFEIDSFGGSAVAADEIADALKNHGKPTIAWIRDSAYSAAYWAATGADIIFASANSDIGSIGVTMSYLDYSKQNLKDGVTYNELSSGKFKDSGNPDKTMTAEEKKLFERDLNIMHENFVKAVAENRNIEIEKVRQLADGSSMLGQMSLENKLIDRIGSLKDVEEYLKETIGQEPKICY